MRSDELPNDLVSGAHLQRGRPVRVSESHDVLQNLAALDRELASAMNANDEARNALAVVNVQLLELRKSTASLRAKVLRDENAKRVAAATELRASGALRPEERSENSSTKADGAAG